MKNVTIDLEELSTSALLEIARCSTDKDVLQAIYEIGIEKNDKVFFLNWLQIVLQQLRRF